MRIAVVDGNNSAFKAYSVMKESRGGLLHNSFGVPTTVIFSMLRTFTSFIEKIKMDRTIICWDTSGSYYRRNLFKLYKKHRTYVDMKDYFAELDAAREHFNVLGFNQLTFKGIEADDCIGLLAHSLRDQGNKVVIVSDDKDFYQTVKSGIRIWRPIKNEFVHADDVRDEFNMEPYKLPRIKALTGEDTDFIPGINEIDEKNMKIVKCGLGPATAIKILKDRKNLSEAIELWQDPPKTKRPWKEKLVSKKKQILLSYKLARIRTKMDQYLDWEKELLKDLMKQALDQREVKLKTIVRLKKSLEFDSMNLPFVLKQLGVKVVE